MCAVHSIRPLYKLLISYQNRHIKNIVKQRRIMPLCRRSTRNFQDRRGFTEPGYLDKHFVKNRKKGLAAKHFGVLSPRYSESRKFKMENLTQSWIFFSIFRKGH